MNIGLIISAVLCGIGLVGTIVVGRKQRHQQVNTYVHGSIERHPVLLNPIFISYLVMFLVFAGIVLYMTYTSNW